MLTLRYLSRADAIAAGADDWHLALDDVRAAIRLLHAGAASMVAESVLPIGADPRAKAYGLPAALGGRYDAAGVKWTVHRAEPLANLPSATSVTFINRMSDGRPIGLVESALLTRMRTAAVSALAMDALSFAPPRHVALVGAGLQAQAHMEMLQALFPSIEAVHVWNRSTARRDAMLAGATPRFGLPLRAHDRLEDAVGPADVILCCTAASEPLIGASAVRPSRVILQVGFDEVTFDAIAASDRVTVDLWGNFAESSAKSLFRMYRAGQFQPSDVAADLIAMVVHGWRAPAGASAYFSSFGLNLFDIALAARVLGRAEAMNIGKLLPLF